MDTPFRQVPRFDIAAMMLIVLRKTKFTYETFPQRLSINMKIGPVASGGLVTQLFQNLTII